MVVKAEDEPIGYIWFTHVASEAEPIIELHICADPEFHGKWLTPRVVKHGLEVIRTLEVGHVVAFHESPPLRKALKFIGFKSYGAFINILKTEDIPWDS